jgi:hypothetical protein
MIKPEQLTYKPFERLQVIEHRPPKGQCHAIVSRLGG